MAKRTRSGRIRTSPRETLLNQYLTLLVTYLRPQWPKVILLAVLLFSSICLQLVNPQIIRYFIDTAQSGGALSKLTNAALFFISLTIVAQIASALAAYFGEDVGWTATNLLRADLVLHCLRLDMSFHEVHTPGELIARIDGDVTTLGDFFSQFVIYLLSNALLLIGILLLLFRENIWLGLALSVYVVIASYIMGRVRGLAIPYYMAMRQVVAEISSFWMERLASIEDIRSCGAKDYTMNLLYQLLRTFLQKVRKSMLAARVFQCIFEVSLALGTALTFALGANLLHVGSLTIGSLYLVFQYVGLLSDSLKGLIQQINNLQSTTASIQRINELYHTKSKIQDGQGTILPPGPFSVEFQTVSFGYSENNLVLRDLTFCLQPGKTLGLLGRTASGKTTITRLLFRFYDLSKGVISLGGVDTRQVKLADLRNRVGIVTQEIQLFQASIRNNLTLFNEEIPDEQILRVIQELDLGEWYSSLSDGLDTQIGPNGGGLSAGQAQLLALMRIFLQDPDLVILDEASSRLDPATEQIVERAIKGLLRNRTAIIIAHRFETIERVDDILILEDGRIREHGPREQLALDSTSHFYNLLQVGLEEVLA